MSREISLGVKPTLIKVLENADWCFDHSGSITNLNQGKSLLKKVIFLVKEQGKLMRDVFDEHDLKGMEEA